MSFIFTLLKNAYRKLTKSENTLKKSEITDEKLDLIEIKEPQKIEKDLKSVAKKGHRRNKVCEMGKKAMVKKKK